MEYIFITLILLSAISNAVMDKLKFHYYKSIFKKFKKQNWWDPCISWKNKWKDGDPSNGEKFWGSSRWFVRLTDAWHFFQGLMYTFFFLSIGFYKIFINQYIDFVLIYFIYTLTFEIFFKYIFNEKKIKE